MMKKWLFLFSILAFACKKKEESNPLINISQYPKTIAYYNVDIATNAQTLRYNINYFYSSNNRFDSINITNTHYKFDYTQFANFSKIKLDYSNGGAIYDEILYDGQYYNLMSYNQILGVNDTARYNFAYDSISRFKSISYAYNNSIDNFASTQTYKKDSVFVYSNFINRACYTTDTIKNSTLDMSKTLPYLLFVKQENNCSSYNLQNILSALPLSSFTNKLPSKIISNNTQTDFSYQFDATQRLTQADIIIMQRDNNTIVSKRRIIISY